MSTNLQAALLTLLLVPAAAAQQVELGRDLPEAEPLSAPASALLPGSDTSLCASWEPTIAVDPNNPLVVAVAQNRTVAVSFDGGNTFPASVTAPVVNGAGDPSVAFDHQGNFFITYLCRPGPGRDVCITGYSCDPGTSTVTQLPGTWPVNVSVASGVGGANADKEWLAADASTSSPFAGRLQVVWIRLDTSPWSVWSSWSSDQGVTWNPAQQLSAADEGTPWPCHVAVGPGGVVYAAWHAQGGFLDPSGGDVPDGVSGQIVLRRSDDGGLGWQPRSVPYGPGNADVTYNVQHEANGVVPGADAWWFGSLQPWILPDPLVAGRVHVVQADDPDNDVDSGDAADVFIVTSGDSGATWGARRRVDQGPPGTFQVFPTAAINPVNGAIAVAYYDNRALADADSDGIFELDFLATSSLDGGVTWSPEVDVNDGRLDSTLATTCRFCGGDGVTNQACGTPACPGPGTTRIGEYVGIAFGECTVHFAWTDNATCGGDFDTFYDRDPQLGGDVTAPEIDCPASVAVGCESPTDPSATGAATASDACDVNPAVTFTDAILPGDCPPGSLVQRIRRTWRATDAAGNQATCVQDIDVTDMAPPALVVPAPLVVECTGGGGIAASDPAVAAWLASASATDDCSVPSLADDAPAFLPAGCLPAGGITAVTFTATDACGHATALASQIQVVDTAPPDLDASLAVVSLWPPNHALVDVGLSITASDSCGAAEPAIVVTVTSDEDAALAPGAGGPEHCPDAVITGDGGLLLRAERSGAGDGRVYRVTVTATDSCGNASQWSGDVTVPTQAGPNGTATDTGQVFDATACP